MKTITENKKINLILKQILILFIYFGLEILLSSLFYNKIKAKNVETSIVLLLIELIMLTIFILIFRKTIIPDFYDFKKNGKKYLKDNFKYWLIGLGVMIITNIFISLFIYAAPSNELEVQLYLEKMPIFYMFAVLISAPIIEELLTRQILKDAFKHKIFYYLISGLIFGALHMLVAESIWELFYIIPYGALGFSFAYMYNKTNNIWTNISFHIIHNTIATILSLLAGWII